MTVCPILAASGLWPHHSHVLKADTVNEIWSRLLIGLGLYKTTTKQSVIMLLQLQRLLVMKRAKNSSLSLWTYVTIKYKINCGAFWVIGGRTGVTSKAGGDTSAEPGRVQRKGRERHHNATYHPVLGLGARHPARTIHIVKRNYQRDISF